MLRPPLAHDSHSDGETNEDEGNAAADKYDSKS
jgi:hypothetical protein